MLEKVPNVYQSAAENSPLTWVTRLICCWIKAPVGRWSGIFTGNFDSEAIWIKCSQEEQTDRAEEPARTMGKGRSSVHGERPSARAQLQGRHIYIQQTKRVWGDSVKLTNQEK